MPIPLNTAATSAAPIETDHSQLGVRKRPAGSAPFDTRRKLHSEGIINRAGADDDHQRSATLHQLRAGTAGRNRTRLAPVGGRGTAADGSSHNSTAGGAGFLRSPPPLTFDGPIGVVRCVPQHEVDTIVHRLHTHGLEMYKFRRPPSQHATSPLRAGGGGPSPSPVTVSASPTLIAELDATKDDTAASGTTAPSTTTRPPQPNERVSRRSPSASPVIPEPAVVRLTEEEVKESVERLYTVSLRQKLEKHRHLADRYLFEAPVKRIPGSKKEIRDHVVQRFYTEERERQQKRHEALWNQYVVVTEPKVAHRSMDEIATIVDRLSKVGGGS